MVEDKTMNFNEKLFCLRRAKGLSQEQLANLINVSRQAVSKWETAEAQPDLSKLNLLCKVFEVSLDELCGGEEKPETPEKPETSEISETPEPIPAAPMKSRAKSWWILATALILGIVIGFPVGVFTSDFFFSKGTQKMERFTITNVQLTSMGHDSKIHIFFSPGIVNESFSYKVLKVDVFGKSSVIPVVCKDGVCQCDIYIDSPHSDVTLSAVMNDGTYEYTAALVRITDFHDNSYGLEELWKS